jgi:hypothetical protein
MTRVARGSDAWVPAFAGMTKKGYFAATASAFTFAAVGA